MNKKCTRCGHAGLKSVAPALYRYRMSGLDNVHLKGGVIEYICPKCGARSTAIKNLIGLHQAIASSLASARRRLTGGELRFLREYLGYSAEDFARIVDYNEDSVRKIESGSQVPKGPYELVLRLAVMRESKAPAYDLRQLADRKEYEFDELRFESRANEWQASNAA